MERVPRRFETLGSADVVLERLDGLKGASIQIMPLTWIRSFLSVMGRHPWFAI
jgi:hypothetical protein